MCGWRELLRSTGDERGLRLSHRGAVPFKGTDHAATALSYCQAIRTAGGTKVAFVRENEGRLPLRPIPEREAGVRDA
jgi:hypothetical protein